MTVPEKINKVRNLMKNDSASVYIVTTSDYHNSEYTGTYFETRKFLSGFTGSAGTLVVTGNEAVLYTDGRYFIQAEKELEGTGITLMKMGVAGTTPIMEYVKEHCEADTYIAVDTKTISAKDGVGYVSIAEIKQGKGIISRDYAGEIWKERPEMSKESVFELDVCYAGEDRKSKISRIRDYMKENECNCHIITTLDDIAWILNIRGNDIIYNPMVLSYLYIDMVRTVLFVDVTKITSILQERLEKDGIEIAPYGEFEKCVKNISEGSYVLYDYERINYAVYSAIPQDVKRVEKTNPAIMMKAVKNHTEIVNEKKAHIKDGVAVTKFIYWLKNQVKKDELTEIDAAEYLEGLRKRQEGYIEPSFATISAYNENAAMMHYNPYTQVPAKLKPEGILLVDSGGQYYEGTTDITRTIALGPVKREIIEHYTAVLRGMLNLSDAKFLKGCIGMNLDILAREPLWEMGLDYRCGTGHGVGYLSGVHEGPNGFRWKKVPEREDGCVIEPGMITTDEPGVYIEGSHGIRIENELLAVTDRKNEYGEFLKFETITFAPIDMELVDMKLMSTKEQELLKKYQKSVYDIISPYLEKDEKTWLYQQCCEF